MLSAVPALAESAVELLELAGTKGGLIVHLGCGDGELTERLRPGDQYFVHGLDTDAREVAATRARIIKRGAYGPVSVDRWDGRNLPYVDNLVNLVVASESESLLQDELLRETNTSRVDSRAKSPSPWAHGESFPDGGGFLPLPPPRFCPPLQSCRTPVPKRPFRTVRQQTDL